MNEKGQKQYLNLVLSGGSVRGISHIGALDRLVKGGYIDLGKLRGLATVSAGSLLGVFIVLGFNIDVVWSFIKLINFSGLISPNPILFVENCGCGFDDGSRVGKVIRDLLEEVTGKSDITFGELFKINKIDYTVVGTCLSTKDPVYFNHINFPDFPVYLAVRISMSMPGLFTPVSFNGKKYIDGALTDNYPIELFHGELDKTVGVLIGGNFNTDYEFPEEYFMAIVNLFSYVCYKRDYNKHQEHTIYINKEIDDISIFNFDIDNKIKNKLYDTGFFAADNFIKNKSK